MTSIRSYISKKSRVLGRYVRKIFSQGLTPHELSLSVVIAIFWGLIPFFGVATPMVTFICLRLKLNLPIAMFLTYALSPLHVGLFIPFIYAGEWMLGIEHLPISIEALRSGLSDDFILTITQRCSQIIFGLFGWLVILLPTSIVLYHILTSLLKHREKSKSQSGIHEDEIT